jgi:hypothetical protein
MLSPYTGENGDLVNMVVVTDPKGMFLDLPREDKGFITKAEGGRELHVDAKYARWYADKDKVETTAEDLEMITSLTKTRSWLMMMI